MVSTKPNNSVRFSLRYYDLAIHEFLTQICKVGFKLKSSCKVEFKLNQKVLGYSHNIYATIVQRGLFYQASHDCDLHGSQLGNTVDFPTPPPACLAPSRTLKASQQR